MQAIVRATNSGGEEWRAKDAYFPALPESFDEYVVRRYGSWSKYNKYKDELRARLAFEWLVCWQVDKKKDKARESNYQVYGCYALIAKVRPLLAYECEELLAAYKKALDVQDDLRVELKLVKAMLSKVSGGDHKHLVNLYNKLSIDKGGFYEVREK